MGGWSWDFTPWWPSWAPRKLRPSRVSAEGDWVRRGDVGYRLTSKTVQSMNCSSPSGLWATPFTKRLLSLSLCRVHSGPKIQVQLSPEVSVSGSGSGSCPILSSFLRPKPPCYCCPAPWFLYHILAWSVPVQVGSAAVYITRSAVNCLSVFIPHWTRGTCVLGSTAGSSLFPLALALCWAHSSLSMTVEQIIS